MTNKPVQVRDYTESETDWLHQTIIDNTPRWAHVLAMAAQYRGMQWMNFFPLPILRYFTDLTVKAEFRMTDPGPGFRRGTLREDKMIRIYKRGRLVAEKLFKGRIIKTPLSKIV